MTQEASETSLSQEIRTYLHTPALKNLPIFCYSETDSTNTRAKLFAASGGGPAVFIAERQTAGRGRRERSFNSEVGGLYISFLTYPKSKASDAVTITVRAAVDLTAAIQKTAGITPKIKWVNDLIADEKKLAGILTEGAAAENGELSYAVCGMGVNLYKREFPKEIADVAISLEDVTGSRVYVARLAASLIEEFFAEKDFSEVIKSYKELSCVIGEDVTVYRAAEEFTARAVDISDRGELIVKTESGDVISLFSGEVSIRKNKN